MRSAALLSLVAFVLGAVSAVTLPESTAVGATTESAVIENPADKYYYGGGRYYYGSGGRGGRGRHVYYKRDDANVEDASEDIDRDLYGYGGGRGRRGRHYKRDEIAVTDADEDRDLYRNGGGDSWYGDGYGYGYGHGY
ncbi:hypothetical protein EDD21DRAFT_437207 [Dissophora ornata]|nr:hypothetical protein EDD21DRAFT_437207 [Dissophora ornata]